PPLRRTACDLLQPAHQRVDIDSIRTDVTGEGIPVLAPGQSLPGPVEHRDRKSFRLQVARDFEILLDELRASRTDDGELAGLGAVGLRPIGSRWRIEHAELAAVPALIPDDFGALGRRIAGNDDQIQQGLPGLRLMDAVVHDAARPGQRSLEKSCCSFMATLMSPATF